MPIAEQKSAPSLSYLPQSHVKQVCHMRFDGDITDSGTLDDQRDTKSCTPHVILAHLVQIATPGGRQCWTVSSQQNLPAFPVASVNVCQLCVILAPYDIFCMTIQPSLSSLVSDLFAAQLRASFLPFSIREKGKSPTVIVV